MKPAIGISPCLDDRGRWKPGRRYAYIDCAYADAVADAGGDPFYFSIRTDPAELLRRADGLLIPGGDDFPPPQSRRYGAGVRFDPVPDAQLEFDTALLEAAERLEIPTLGICYGMQLMALRAGATLHHHLPEDLPTASAHDATRSSDGNVEPRNHAIRVVPGSWLAGVLGSEAVQVNSLHHQAVADPGAQIEVTARAADGVIEAIEQPGRALRVGVQWHPEKSFESDRSAIFGGFVSSCSIRAPARAAVDREVAPGGRAGAE